MSVVSDSERACVSAGERMVAGAVHREAAARTREHRVKHLHPTPPLDQHSELWGGQHIPQRLRGDDAEPRPCAAAAHGEQASPVQRRRSRKQRRKRVLVHGLREVPLRAGRDRVAHSSCPQA